MLSRELREIASLYVTGDGAAARRGGRRMDGDSGATVSDWTVYPVGTNSSRGARREGKEENILELKSWPRTGFLLDDR